MNDTDVKDTQDLGPISQTKGQDVAFIEKIENKRVNAGKVEYYLKWIDYSEDHNIWVPVEKLHCKDLIKQYEDECKKTNKQEIPVPSKREVDLIIGLTYTRGQNMFLIKWKDTLKGDLVPVEVANKTYTQSVIDFYEKQIEWTERNRNNNNNNGV